MKQARRLLAGLLPGLLAGPLVAACSHSTGTSGTSDPTAARLVPPAMSTPQVRASLTPDDRYAAAMDTAAAAGLRVWVETDLVKAWQRGPDAFARTAARVRLLAARRGVDGVKVADELGYHDGLDASPGRALAFLRDAAAALRPAGGTTNRAPAVLIDLVVPELGCAPGLATTGTGAARCRAAARSRYPTLRLEEVDRLLAAGHVDVVDLSTSLLGASTYAGWGIDAAAAQRAAWQEVARRGWGRHVRLNARKALAHPGVYTGDPRADLRTYLDVPMATGAHAVDVWTWRQRYRGRVVGLTDPGGRPNALWNALRRRHEAGVPLLTHFTPSLVQTSVSGDLRMLREAFTGVFVAAGTG